MKIDDYGQPIFTEEDLVDHLMKTGSLPLKTPILCSDPIDTSSIRFLVDELPVIQHYEPPNIPIEEFDGANQKQWLMPTSYQELDIAKFVLDRCEGEAELQRAGEELLLFVDRDLLDLLRYLVYLVDTMRENNIVWGVGRGSSVASFVLFKLGVHRVNSLHYDLDIREFLR